MRSLPIALKAGISNGNLRLVRGDCASETNPPLLRYLYWLFSTHSDGSISAKMLSRISIAFSASSLAALSEPVAANSSQAFSTAANCST